MNIIEFTLRFNTNFQKPLKPNEIKKLIIKQNAVTTDGIYF